MFESTIFQINLGHRRAASYDLQLRTKDMTRFIAMVQEPWIVKGKIAGLSGHKTIMALCDSKTPPRAPALRIREWLSPCAGGGIRCASSC